MDSEKTTGRGLNLELEQQHQSESDWKFSALSQPSIINIPLNQRAIYLPQGEKQNIGEEKNDCATRSPINHLEIQFNYGYINKIFKPENLKWLEDNGYIESGRVVFSDRFIAILSGTDPARGNSLKAPIDTIYRKGLIPKAIFPQVASRDEYYDVRKITPEMTKLGEEFLKRFTINYEQVAAVHMPELLKDEVVGVAGYAWPTPINQIYPRTENGFNHAFLTFDPAIYAFDNYLDWNKENTAQVEGDFVKQLAKDYTFHDYGYRIFISKESSAEDIKQADLFTLAVQWVTQIIAWLNGGKVNEMPKMPEELEQPTPVPVVPIKSNQEKLLESAKAFLGKEASPKDRVPDDVACVESLGNVIRNAGIKFPDIYGTADAVAYFKLSPDWEATLDLTPGNVIINATGSGNGTMKGHCGVIGEVNRIYSNDSRSGLFTAFYSIQTWKERYRMKGGMPTRVFKPK